MQKRDLSKILFGRRSAGPHRLTLAHGALRLLPYPFINVARLAMQVLMTIGAMIAAFVCLMLALSASEREFAPHKRHRPRRLAIRYALIEAVSEGDDPNYALFCFPAPIHQGQTPD
jgi:hypothetical protein